MQVVAEPLWVGLLYFRLGNSYTRLRISVNTHQDFRPKLKIILPILSQCKANPNTLVGSCQPVVVVFGAVDVVVGSVVVVIGSVVVDVVAVAVVVSSVKSTVKITVKPTTTPTPTTTTRSPTKP